MSEPTIKVASRSLVLLGALTVYYTLNRFNSHLLTVLPPGQSIAVAHDPPRVTLHSVQDGHEERSILLPAPSAGSRNIIDVWWFRTEKIISVKAIPDIFKRNGLIVRLRSQLFEV
jgi:hypothetical protein